MIDSDQHESFGFGFFNELKTEKKPTNQTAPSYKKVNSIYPPWPGDLGTEEYRRVPKSDH